MTDDEINRRTSLRSEGTFTRPSLWQPNPSRWHAVDEQATEAEVSELVGGFVRALQPDYCIETGTHLGQTAALIAFALQRNGHGLLDTFEIDPERAAAARHILGPLPAIVREQDSLSFTPDRPIEFAWFDSETYLRVREFQYFRRWMMQGTICGFHDTAPHHGLWSQAIAEQEKVRTITLRTPRGVTFLEVL